MANDDPCGDQQELPVNMYEASDAVVLVTPMPAIMGDDIRVSIEGRTITIEADCRTEAPKDYLLHEWHYGPYHRTLELPEGYGGDAEGSFANGQLALRVLKGTSNGTPRVTINAKH